MPRNVHTVSSFTSYRCLRRYPKSHFSYEELEPGLVKDTALCHLMIEANTFLIPQSKRFSLCHTSFVTAKSMQECF